VNSAAADETVYPVPPTFEELGIGYGYVLYSTFIYGPSTGEHKLELLDLRDRATVYVNGEYIGTAMRDRELPPIKFEVPDEGARLDILVENMGRICYGNKLCDSKGIIGGVKHGVNIFGWKAYALPFDSLPQCYVSDNVASCERPTLFRGSFTARGGVDTFIRLDGWQSGFVVINGFNIGRYRGTGPQETLYVPGELLVDGENTVEVFEVHSSNASVSVYFTDTHVIDGAVK